MPKLTEKKYCNGCSACSSICPTQAISMQKDRHGFLFPIINSVICVECGKCERTCPVVNPAEEQFLAECYAARCKDLDLRKQSSSGGIFGVLASSVLEKKGVVYGCALSDQLFAEHIRVENPSDLIKLQRSKYMQSNIGKTLTSCLEDLNAGRFVLFSGTPCQIAGLNSFLQKQKFSNLLTVEVICHGAPAPGSFEKYKNELENIYQKQMVDYSFVKPVYSFPLSPITGSTINFPFSARNSLLIKETSSICEILPKYPLQI